MKLITPILIVAALFFSTQGGYCQDSTLANLKNIPEKYFGQVDKKISNLNDEFKDKSEKYIDKLISIQSSMLRKIGGNEQKLEKQLTQSLDSLKKLKAVLSKTTNQITAKADKVFRGDYNSYLDTLTNSLDFLKNFQGYLSQGGEIQEKLKSSLEQLEKLKQGLKQADQIKQYIKEQKAKLQTLTQNLKIPGLSKDLAKFNKTVFYYQQQFHEWKEVFTDPKKAEEKALAILRNIPAFQEFMEKNSILAGLFNIPSNYGQNLGGLQTRTMVTGMLQTRMGAGPDASHFLNEQLGAAQSHLSQLQNKLPFLDNAAEMPSFKPNELKTKSFKQRLEFGYNLQFNRATNALPNRSEIAAQLAYKLNKNGSFGLGVGYKLGMGTSLSDIRFTHEGVGFRGFFDTKMKGKFYINGGFEYNYYSSFESFERLPGASAWQSSALIGITKKVKVGKKMNKSISIQYDILHRQHIPYTEPIKFRLGYQF